MTHNGPTSPSRGVIVVGMPSAGTGTLTSLLDGHPEVLTTPHPVLATDWFDADDPVDELTDASRGEFATRLRRRVDGPTDVVTATRAVFETVAKTAPTDASTWVARTSRHLPLVPVLMRDFGRGTRIVCVVRDPRAMLASVTDGNGRPLPRDVEAFCRRWVTADRLVGHYVRRYASDLIVVRHEDLLDRPEYAMRRVAKHVGIAWHPALLEHAPGAPDTGRAWCEVLDPDVIELVEQLVGHRLARWGYDASTPAADRVGIRRMATEAVCLGRELRARRRWSESTNGAAVAE